MLEQYEEVVEDWYFRHQDQRLENFLCQNHVLKTSEQGRRQPFDPTLLLLLTFDQEISILMSDVQAFMCPLDHSSPVSSLS